MLLPTTTTFLPSSSILLLSIIFITALAVHGANPSFSPAKIFAIFLYEIPSRSFFSSSASITFFSSICFGRGLKRSIPSIFLSAFIFLNSSKNSSDEILSSNSNTLVFNVSDSIFLIAPFSYERSAGFAPILTIPRVGVYPFKLFFILSISSFITFAVSAPYSKIIKVPPKPFCI